MQPQNTRLLLGRVLATPGAIDALVATDTHPLTLLKRHANGDWGELCPEDHAANQLALAIGARVLSTYTLPDGTGVYVITDSDRSLTTILLKGDY